MKLINAVLFSFFAAVLMGGVFGVAVAKEVSAPFGLEWGQSQDEIRALGVVFAGKNSGKCYDKGAYKNCYVKSPPKSIGEDGAYYLQISPKYGLMAVEYWISGLQHNIAEKKFAEMKSNISAKYGRWATNKSENDDRAPLPQFLWLCQDSRFSEDCSGWSTTWTPSGGGIIALRWMHRYDSDFN